MEYIAFFGFLLVVWLGLVFAFWRRNTKGIATSIKTQEQSFELQKQSFELQKQAVELLKEINQKLKN